MDAGVKRSDSRLSVALFSFLFSLLFTFIPCVLSVDRATADNGTIYLDSASRNTGTDCLFEKGPILTAPKDRYLVNCEPSNEKRTCIYLAWNQVCSATTYELQISKDAGFTILIMPKVNSNSAKSSEPGTILLDLESGDVMHPCACLSEGALPECGATYYWRVRATKSYNGQIERSPWSDSRRLTVKGGIILGHNIPIQLLYPEDSIIGLNLDNMTFSWSPWKQANKYQFELARDYEFKNIVIRAVPTTTTYSYNGSLEYGTKYFWHTKALEVNHEDIPSDWSATYSFTTKQAPPLSSPSAPPDYTLLWITAAVSAILAAGLVILVRLRRKTPRR
jgi:hypothetical protein